MLPDVGATELLLIAAVALIVVGPKDLPMLMRKVGQFVARMRGMANEFRASFDDMARQSELDELRKQVQALRAGDFLTDAEAAAQATEAEVQDVFNEIHADMTYPDVQEPLSAEEELAARGRAAFPPGFDPDPAHSPTAAEAAAAPVRKPRASRAKPKGDGAVAKPKAAPRAPRKPKPAPEAEA